MITFSLTWWQFVLLIGLASFWGDLGARAGRVTADALKRWRNGRGPRMENLQRW